MSAAEALFKHAKLGNYSFKMLKFSIFYTLVTQTFIKKVTI